MDAPTPQASPRRWIQAKRPRGLTIHESSGCPSWNRRWCYKLDDCGGLLHHARVGIQKWWMRCGPRSLPRVPVPADPGSGRGHRPRMADRVCFWGILVRLVTGCSWVTAERLLGGVVSDTTLRARRDEWIAAGVFAELEAEAGYDRVVGLDLSETSVDGSMHKAPCGGAGTGKSPVDRGKLGWKWSILTDRSGIPVSRRDRRRQPP